jgi:hypothetical protein
MRRLRHRASIGAVTPAHRGEQGSCQQRPIEMVQLTKNAALARENASLETYASATREKASNSLNPRRELLYCAE